MSAAQPVSRPKLALLNLLAAAVMWGMAALSYLYTNTRTTFACERAADTCTLIEVYPLSREEIDRFRLRDVTTATHKELTRKNSTINCAQLPLRSRTAPVEICGRADAEYVARVNAFLGDASAPAFSATLDHGYAGRLLSGIVLAASIFPLLLAVYLLLMRRPGGAK